MRKTLSNRLLVVADVLEKYTKRKRKTANQTGLAPKVQQKARIIEQDMAAFAEHNNAGQLERALKTAQEIVQLLTKMRVNTPKS